MLAFSFIKAILLAAATVAAETTTSAITSATTDRAAATSGGKLTLQELAALPLKQRLMKYPWKLEMITVSFIALYLITFYLGSKYNEKLVNKFVNSILPVFKENFFQVGVTKSRLMAKDDTQHFTFYATGRLRIESMIAKFELQSRQNPFVWVMEYVSSFFIESLPAPEDKVSFNFQIDADGSSKFDDFIWAIVHKDHMNEYRKENYFLSLTKTSESDKLPVQFVFMNEAPQMTSTLYSSEFPDLLEKCKDLIKFFAVTDQAEEKPDRLSKLKPSKRFVLEMRVPKTKADVAAANEFLSFLLKTYIDFVCKNSAFRPEVTRKCKKTRESEYAKLKKSLETARKEDLDSKKAEAEKDRRAKLTPEEQDKLAKRQSDRRQRRTMNRQKVRS
ncbi:hypothetical protein FOA43_001548 [Brettanomyces nanus]|uniref:DUF1682 domain-containing protein n=1 Tax=Eeniella nana TaxID=13502 RepID=A0A875RZY3_EENNA|nr:uncharacterized protein FOA43_001548 [Brettanomyces nanus]QPG74223.1 hypothetical protein FOA43_001548 [Brettanomyces nanus]